MLPILVISGHARVHTCLNSASIRWKYFRGLNSMRECQPLVVYHAVVNYILTDLGYCVIVQVTLCFIGFIQRRKVYTHAPYTTHSLSDVFSIAQQNSVLCFFHSHHLIPTFQFQYFRSFEVRQTMIYCASGSFCMASTRHHNDPMPLH